MYYRLKEGHALCSWQGQPYGIRDTRTGAVHFLRDKDAYLLLYRCGGGEDLDALPLSESQRQALAGLVREQVLAAYPEPHPMEGAIPAKIYRNRYRRGVLWSVTGRCNYRCRHCFQSAARGELGQPSGEELRDMIRQFDACGISEVSITGGEPLIRGDFFEILEELHAHPLTLTTIYSNGALVNEALLDRLDALGFHPSFQISFDGVGWHDWMRGVPGAEEAALRAIRLLRRRGFPVTCAMALCRENVPSLMETVRTLEKAGCCAMKVQRCFPQGEWLHETGHTMDDEELFALYMDFLGQIVRGGVRMPVQMEGIYSVFPDRDTGRYRVKCLFDPGKDAGEDLNLPSCEVTLHEFFLGPNGAVVPCMNMCGAPIERLFPNLKDMSLQDILTDSDYLGYASVKSREIVEHNPKCRECASRLRCRGGQCRAMALQGSGTDYLACDEFSCRIFRSGWREKLLRRAEEAAAWTAES